MMQEAPSHSKSPNCTWQQIEARVQLDAMKQSLCWNLLWSQHKLIITLLLERNFIYN